MDRIYTSAAADAAVEASQDRALSVLLGEIHKPADSNVFELSARRSVRGPTAPNFNRVPNERELAALASHFQSYVSAVENLPLTVKAFGAIPPRNLQARLDVICAEFADMAAELMPAPVDAA